MTPGPHARLEGVLPVAPPRSLLSIPGVEFMPPDARWLNGIEIEPEPCDVTLPGAFADLTADTTDYPYWWTICEGSTTPEETIPSGIKAIGQGPDRVVVEPFLIWKGYRCSTLDVHNPDRQREIDARVTRALNAFTPAAVEHELWTGQVATAAGYTGNPFLADGAAVTEVLGGAQFGYVTALAEMEQALADANPVGEHIIHAQPRVVTAWASEGLLTLDPTQGSLKTVATGTHVNPGTGYPGTDPFGTESVSYGQSYIYGTGKVRVILEAPRQLQITERTQNSVEVRRERAALIVFDACPLIGALVNLCDRTCGPAS